MIKHYFWEIVVFSLIYYVTLILTKDPSYINLMYIELWALHIVIRTFAYFYFKKYLIPKKSLKAALILILWANASIIFATVFILSVTHFSQIPRTFVVQFLMVPAILDALIIFFRSHRRTQDSIVTVPLHKGGKGSISLLGLICWLSSVIIVYNLITYLKYGGINYSIYTRDILLLIFPAWVLSALITHKNHGKNEDGVYLILAQHVKASIILVTLLSLPHFFLRLDHLSRLLLFGTAALSGLIELILVLLIHLYKKSSLSHLDSIDQLFDEKGDVKQESLSTNNPLANYLLSKSKLDEFSSFLRDDNPLEIKYYLDKITTEKKLESGIFSLLSTSTCETIDIQSENSLLINFHNCNDQRRICKYLISCHNSLRNGGLLVGFFEPLEIVNRNLKNRLPRILYLFISPIHFIFHRIIPKMWLTSFLYFLFTRGKNRIVSKAEMFGRLSYCGFDVMAAIPMKDKTAFIAQKTKAISSELKPSFRAIVRLKRVGYKGEIINIYKVRTMHPYSEFLQKYVYDNFKLDDSGKFKNDFRLTSWGKLLRKTWIDELPQLFNWIRGEVKLVGVRALSYHYYSLYPESIKKLRITTKPGLIPPFYVDLPNSFNGIVASEEKYLLKYQKNPITTDLIYLIKALLNILMGSRSH
jgi:lipopolysaccharide/colanic/teichoic acid biosynthesis glycosyltransferase